MIHNEKWFRDKLHDIRKTQADLTRHMDLDRATIVRLINGSRKVRIDELNKLAQFFECKIIDILENCGVDCTKESKASVLNPDEIDKELLGEVVAICMEEYLQATDIENFDPAEISQIVSTVYLRAAATERSEFENKMLAADIIDFSRKRKV